MGYTTDFLGHIGITPSLNAAERVYLAAFSASRRCRHPDGPYSVPQNPAAERDGAAKVGASYSETAEGQPSLWCDWTPCWDGACLSHSGIEKSYNTTRWMAYLIEHFLAPDALAARSKLAYFDDFTFDHVLDGTVAACRRDTRELYLIRVQANQVREEVLVHPEPTYLDLPPLPYETEIDRRSQRRSRRRRSTT